MLHIAILGAGNIAGTMAKTLNGMEEKGQRFCCYAVAAREYERAKEFAEKHGFEKAYGSYEVMLADIAVALADMKVSILQVNSQKRNNGRCIVRLR